MPPWQRLAVLRNAVRHAEDPSLLAVRTGLCAALLALVLHLVLGDDPWTGGIAEREREGEPVRPIDYARTFGWWTAAANTALLGALLASTRRWHTRGPVATSSELAPPARRPGALLALVVAAAMGTSAVLSHPRLSHSLWGDEEYSVRRAIDGFHVSDGVSLEHQRVEWRDTFWFYNAPNNHIPHSILARLSIGAWRGIAQPEQHYVSEVALRLPAYAAGVASIGWLALFVWRIGFPFAAGLAAWILALHPWHLRYASEARGYSLMLALVPLTLTALVAALHRGTWGRWALFGAGQVLLLWTYPGALYLLAFTNMIAAAALWHLHRRTPRLRQQLPRWLVANLLAAGAWMQLMLPNMMQYLEYLERRDVDKDAYGFAVAALSHGFGGVAWTVGKLGEHYVELRDVALAWPGLFRACALLTALLVAAGFLYLLRAGGTRALLALALLVPAPLTLYFSLERGDMLYPVYVLFALPGFIALLCVGLTGSVDRLAPARAARGVAAGAAVAYLAAWGFLTQPVRSALRELPLERMRESVQHTRPTLDLRAPENQRILTASFERPAFYYDPLTRWLSSADDLRDLMREADETGKALFINYGRAKLAERRDPELRAMLEDEALLEHVATLHGFEPRGARYIYRYRGAGDG